MSWSRGEEKQTLRFVAEYVGGELRINVSPVGATPFGALPSTRINLDDDAYEARRLREASYALLGVSLDVYVYDYDYEAPGADAYTNPKKVVLVKWTEGSSAESRPTLPDLGERFDALQENLVEAHWFNPAPTDKEMEEFAALGGGDYYPRAWLDKKNPDPGFSKETNSIRDAPDRPGYYWYVVIITFPGIAAPRVLANPNGYTLAYLAPDGNVPLADQVPGGA